MMKRFWLQLKGMGIMFFLPILGYLLFIPFCVMILNRNVEEAERRFFAAQHMCYQFIPILSTIWMYMFQKEYVEGEGREILILGRKIPLFSFIYWILNLPFIWASLHILKDTEGYREDLFYEMLVASFMICGLVFFLNFAISSISLSILLVVLYIWLSNVDIENVLVFRDGLQDVQQASQYLYVVLKGGGLMSEQTAVYSAMGALFWLCGLFKARRL